ncbi:MAG TPA: leucyl aminopeptidase family protein [Oligoflexus sp.]|uniref:M17 family metallopeptidase n=1 Tax=Oligoflexus sp. TaxID=1971216 RepID=UPI002D42F7E6|nr:leucyl aminopeptidase family protein [Oligoflexus sp.]HYX38479.1 leucyl aminopeptidase family protein [Oligoflexus sp.]
MAKTLSKVLHQIDQNASSDYDAYVGLLWQKPGSKEWDEIYPEHMVQADRDILRALVQREPLKPEAGSLLCFDRTPLQRWVIAVANAEMDTFRWLCLGRQIMKPLKEHGCKKVLADLNGLPAPQALQAADALTAAAKALLFKFPKYSQNEAKKKDAELTLDVLCPSAVNLDEAARVTQHAESTSAANNQVRHLVMQAGNDLTPSQYVARLKKLAEQNELGYAFTSQKKLETMGAGAFLAVAQGSAHEDAGLVKLSYEGNGKKNLKHLVLVGKGVTFDTGGHNIKSSAGMYGMHRDMAGSALAYSVVALAAKEKWPVRVTAFLAIAENAIGPNSYRQNDVITALNGKTIEIIDTDAEGRMLLADTLHIASGEKPDLLLDFATLTGSCVRALSTLYSGVFTNRQDLVPGLISAGRESGERVWPFPMDPDFAECLKSDIADIKQCRVSGGVDHIEASLFLKEFVGKDIPWVHLDLSAAENSGGLAHIDTEVTGFGVRFVSRFVRNYWGWSV